MFALTLLGESSALIPQVQFRYWSFRTGQWLRLVSCTCKDLPNEATRSNVPSTWKGQSLQRCQGQLWQPRFPPKEQDPDLGMPLRRQGLDHCQSSRMRWVNRKRWKHHLSEAHTGSHSPPISLHDFLASIVNLDRHRRRYLRLRRCLVRRTGICNIKILLVERCIIFTCPPAQPVVFGVQEMDFWFVHLRWS